MNDVVSLSKSALLALIGARPFPNDPNDPDILEELGNLWWHHPPLSRQLLEGFLIHPSSEAWRLAFGPQPEPWNLPFGRSKLSRSLVLARSVIEKMEGQVALAEIVAGSDGVERAVAAGKSILQDLLDDLCGTPPRWPRWKHPHLEDPYWRFKHPNAIDLLVAGRELQRAVESRNHRPLREAFSEAADRLIATGLERLEGEAREGGDVVE